jgi:CBS domain containing-hemolysin-like protein
VDEVMVPRPDIVALPLSLTPSEALAAILDQPFTRYPVYGEDLDDLRGILHLRRLIVAVQNGGRDRPDLQEIIRPAYRVPETKRLGVLLAELRRTHAHMAIVFDEYGSTAGVVTLEDLLEEIVGEIDDEFDRPEDGILRLTRDRIRIAGGFPIFDFNDRFGFDLPSEDYNTVGGIVFGELGREPQPGDVVDAFGVRFSVHGTDGPRITSLDVDLRTPGGVPAEPA